MLRLRKTAAVSTALVVLLSLGCQASGDDAPKGTGGTHGAGGNLNLGGGVELPAGTDSAALLPARIRRLTDAEYQASVSALVPGAADGISADFVPDSRQSGFTVNEAQRVDPVFAGQLAEAAETLAKAVAQGQSCANAATGAAACAEAFIRSFGEQTYRRPLGEPEVQELLKVFNVALDGGSYAEGIELTVRAMLQSAAFLYLTEIGEAPAATIKLTPHELAASISYLIQGRPPTQSLLAAAARGDLDTPEGRAKELESLFGGEARDRVVRVVREWLGSDRIVETAKDATAYAEFADVRADMDRETTEFLQVVVYEEQASLAKLLSADFTVANDPLAKIYGVSAPSQKADVFERVATPNRLGILNQGAFLSVFAHADGSAPVLRGVALMRRVACIALGNPVDLKISVVPPAPDPNKTTRDRFSVHSTDVVCAGCHQQIDNFGFAFEQFDGMGQLRDMDAGQAVDSSAVIMGTDFDGAYPSSNELVTAMAKSTQVRECFARHVFRALSGTSDPALSASEDDFVNHWSSTGQHADPNTGQMDANIIDTLVAYVTSPAFAFRRAQ